MSDIKFRTTYDRYQVFMPECSPYKVEKQLRVVDNEYTLVDVGKTDWYEYIQSHKDSVDIHKILERCAMLDDYSYLNRMPAQFMDVTEMPKNLSEAFSMVKDAEHYFEKMPTNIKEKYNNNFLEFISDIGSDNFVDTVTKFVESVKEKATIKDVEEEVKE